MTDVSDSPRRSFNWRHLLGIVVLLALIAGAVYVITNERGGDAVVASLGDLELTESELFAILDSMEPILTEESYSRPEASNVIRNWIVVEAVAAELADVDVLIDQDATDLGRDTVMGQALDPSSAFGQYLVRNEAVGSVLVGYAEDRIEVDTEIPEFLCSSHILLDTEVDAEAAFARAEDGEDFAALAIELWVGPAGPGGGNLGCVNSFSFIPEFVEGARSSGGSGIVGPVETDFGFHVIEVRSIGPLDAETHPEMDPDAIASELASIEGQAEADEVNLLINMMVSDAQARIAQHGSFDPQFGAWDPISGLVLSSGVTG